MKNKIIGMVFVVMMLITTMQPVMATTLDSSIPLCSKPVNTGGSWGVCTGQEAVKGTFNYDASGTDFVFDASATGLIAGNSYTLIYYKDTDINHILDSTKNVNTLDTAIADESNAVAFSGSLDMGSIPASDDVNPRGKIWIVPTDEINPDYTLKWTEYANGATMPGYLFESDKYTTENDPMSPSTVQTRMGGIIYTKTVVSTDSFTGTVIICGLPTIGVDVPETTINFGNLYPGETSTEQYVVAAITQTAQQGCSLIAISTSVEVVLGEWNTPEMTTSVDNPNVNPVVVSTALTSLIPIGFTATAGQNVVPGTYTQIITLSATF